MYLSDKELYKYRKKLEQGLFGEQVILNANGTFYIYNVKEADVPQIKRKLENSKIVGNISITQSQYDFSSADSILNVGMKMLPKSLYTIRGILKDDLTEAAQKQKYFYKGPAFKYEHNLGNFDLVTTAVSFKQALNNIRVKVAQISGWPIGYITVIPKYLSQAPEIKEPEEELEIKYCEFCGQQLTDSGECPICDYGEENLDEAVEIHDTLNPKLWDEKNELLPEVRDKIEDIIEEFKKQLAEDNIQIDIVDVQIIGSNANFNYTDTSDLDVHLIVDESDDCAKKHLNLIYDICRRLFNKKYDISIKGINVELYVENKENQTNNSAGRYSLKDGWINDPTNFEIPNYSEDTVDVHVDIWQEEAEDIIQNPSVKAIDAFLDKLYDYRIEDVQKNGEFGEFNLAFKEIRRLGYLDQLRDLRDKLKSEELSLKEDTVNLP